MSAVSGSMDRSARVAESTAIEGEIRRRLRNHPDGIAAGLPDFFHPLTRLWFAERFAAPTPPQSDGWPAIHSRVDTLIAAPTGSGKTLTAFLVQIDALVRAGLEGRLPGAETSVVYVSPLKALSNDVERNLTGPLAEIQALAAGRGLELPSIRVGLRTGDTTPADRQKLLRKPPHILVTTPESLFLMLTAEKSRRTLRSVETIIIDEIHALARDKRGSHLALTLERLDAYIRMAAEEEGVESAPRDGAARERHERPLRIGLSATQKPIEDIARFLTGVRTTSAGFAPRPVSIVDSGHRRDLDLAVEVPPSELSAVCSNEQWEEVYGRLKELIDAHRSTLIFVNTRAMAERVSFYLCEHLGEDAVGSHHGSLSKDLRLAAEQKLKNGQLKAIVATASLELGIDIGYIDLVCQIGSPRSIATFLQRVGRSGHAVGALPKGRLFALTRDELVESLALTSAVRRGELDVVEQPRAPLDILAQQMIAASACDEWRENELFECIRGASPYARLTREDYDEVLNMLARGYGDKRQIAYVHHDPINGVLRGRKNARLAALTSGGAIPEQPHYRVVNIDDGSFVGTIHEDFAVERPAGTIFLLGNNSWQMIHTRGLTVSVRDAKGAPPSMPFWFGEAPGRTFELSRAVSELRIGVGDRLALDGDDPVGAAKGVADLRDQDPPAYRAARAFLAEQVGPGTGSPQAGRRHGGQEATGAGTGSPEAGRRHGGQEATGAGTGSPEAGRRHGGQEATGAGTGSPEAGRRHGGQEATGAEETALDQSWAILQAVHYIAVQKAGLGLVPSQEKIVFERFFDQTGGMQLVVHAPFGTRINRGWGLALRKSFCRSFDFELQASADDEGIVLSLGEQQSFPIEQLFRFVRPENVKELLEQAFLQVPFFRTRWQWNANRALAVLRTRAGKRVAPALQRMRGDDLLTAVFPASTQCFEHITGDIELPDHPLVKETMHDCLHEAADLERLGDLVARIQSGEIEMIARDTREPSPFAYERLNASPYAFLDDAGLLDRRARALAQRRTLPIDELRDLAQLDEAAIRRVAREAWPLARNTDELHDVLQGFGLLFVDDIAGAGPPDTDEGPALWRELFDELVMKGRAALGRLVDEAGRERRFWFAAERLPLVQALYPDAGIEPSFVLPERLRSEWSSIDARQLVLGAWLDVVPMCSAEDLARVFAQPLNLVTAQLEAIEAGGGILRGHFRGAAELLWCDRRLLQRIHRLTLEGLRDAIRPVGVPDFMHYLAGRHGLLPGTRRDGVDGLRAALLQLEGFEIPAGAFENEILPARLEAYDPAWLDEVCRSGEWTYGRLVPPARDEDAGPLRTAMSRSAPIAFVLREDLEWAVPARTINEEGDAGGLSEPAESVLGVLTRYGAQFSSELRGRTGLQPADLDAALGELIRAGRLTADGFAALRPYLSADFSKRDRVRRLSPRPFAPRGVVAADGGGRWALFPGVLFMDRKSAKSAPPGRAKGADPETEHDRRVEGWAWLLLDRYGVIFYDLLAREKAAPAWSELRRTLRRLEAQGRVRGGRFITGAMGRDVHGQGAATEGRQRLVSGEQFALPGVVDELRAARDRDRRDEWFVISAADPLNLAGVLWEGDRIGRGRQVRLVIQDGRHVATHDGGQVAFHADLPPETVAHIHEYFDLPQDSVTGFFYK